MNQKKEESLDRGWSSLEPAQSRGFDEREEFATGLDSEAAGDSAHQQGGQGLAIAIAQ